jgi:nitroreductase
MNLDKLKETAKKFLAVPVIRKFRNRANLYLYKLLSVSRIFAVPYHLIFSRAFDREIFAFTNAVKKYNSNIYDVHSSNVVLRRNIHRLEKGLIMEDRRTIFALDYILETVENYALILQRSDEVDLELGEIHWAHDVLCEYFGAVADTHATTRNAKDLFENLPKPKAIEKTENFIPYESRKRARLKIPSYEEMINLSRKRRSVRWFKDKKVPREDIDKALKAASLAPSACNRQPFKYRIFDNSKLTKEIASLPFGTSGYADNIPMIIVIVGDLSNYFSPRDRHVIYIDASLSAMSFMFALETLGLSSVAINWPDFGLLENKMKKKLNLKVYERPVLMLGVGYAKDEGKIPFSQKKPLDQLRSYNDLGENQ